MADSKVAESQISASFVHELLPAAEKTALLYHLSYLCLANFPNLERIIRSQAVETQMLFGSSDATMLKCILTSKNLVESLFPMVLIAIDNNLPSLAVDYLAKAQLWIKDIIHDVNRIVEKYELHNKEVASSTSAVFKEKHDTEARISAQDLELKQTQDTLNKLKSDLQNTTAELTAVEQKISSKTQEIQDFAKSVSQTSTGLGIFAAVVPFVGSLVKSIYNAVEDPKHIAQMKALETELNVLIADKSDLKQKQWQLQLQIIDWQMKAAKASFDRNSIPDPIHLEEVQTALTKIQAILIQIKNFWEGVSKLLEHLEQKTFAGEYFLKHINILKKHFITSIAAAGEAWSSFGESCERASIIFKQQTKDAYKFLEVSPSSLSKEQWQEEYEKVKARLEKIDPSPSLPSSEKPAITEGSDSAANLK